MEENKLSEKACDVICAVFPERFQSDLRQLLRKEVVTEIRVRKKQQVTIRTNTSEKILKAEKTGMVFLVSDQDLKVIFQKLSQYSVYAHKEEIGQGFITLEGGHRVGLCGTCYKDGEGRFQLKQITSLNLRIARAWRGCADSLLPELVERGRFCHTLLISPPGYGKTTYLRDLIWQLSNGSETLPGQNIGLVDERSEIGNYSGRASGFDLGVRTDVLNHCPKAVGMMMLLRSMAPDIICADELGGREDLITLKHIKNCGCKLLMTIHGDTLEDVLHRPWLESYLKEYPFERYVVIQKEENGRRRLLIYNEQAELLNVIE